MTREEYVIILTGLMPQKIASGQATLMWKKLGLSSEKPANVDDILREISLGFSKYKQQIAESLGGELLPEETSTVKREQKSLELLLKGETARLPEELKGLDRHEAVKELMKAEGKSPKQIEYLIKKVFDEDGEVKPTSKYFKYFC